MTHRYSVVGLGKLGASMTAAIAKRGFKVTGVDIDARAVEAVNAGRAPVAETDLGETIAQNRSRIRATTDHGEAVRNSDITFVIVPTPSEPDGSFALDFAKNAFDGIGRALAEKDGYHTVALTSTVTPGSTRQALLPVIEAASGKTAGRDFGLCYSPEFIALGSVIRDFLNPDFSLIGEIDARAGDHLESAYNDILENGAPCKRMSLENAELTKLAVNTFVTTKIVFANMVADFCERLPGGDVDAVADALGADARIGRRYLTGGLGYGGPCFPRDNGALGAFGGAMGVRADVAAATDALNQAQTARIADRISTLIAPGATVAVLGLAYKPHSNVVEQSHSLRLIEALNAAGMRVVAHDPLAGAGARRALAGKADVLDDLGSCLDQADAVVVATPDPAFATLASDDLPRRAAPVVVYDCWRLLRDALEGAPNVSYWALGLGARPS